MNSNFGIILFLAMTVYFLYTFKKNFDKKKALYAQGEYKEFNYLLPSFYIYVICAFILLGYVGYSYKHMSLFEIFMGFVFFVIILISAFLNRTVVLANDGIFFIYYYLEYKKLDGVGIQKLRNGKFSLGFISNKKIIFSMKLKETEKNMVRDFMAKRKVHIEEF
ncbi:MAG: hypothetical protein ACRDDY_11405 [Clostridium sp.]|uniref:hypothetical protein n=1 Tax=Clostridium sp. TaxID=1506 RepID=UPI003EE43265